MLKEKKTKLADDYNVEECLVNNNEGVNDNIVEEGDILKVKRNTLTEN